MCLINYIKKRPSITEPAINGKVEEVLQQKKKGKTIQKKKTTKRDTKRPWASLWYMIQMSLAFHLNALAHLKHQASRCSLK